MTAPLTPPKKPSLGRRLAKAWDPPWWAFDGGLVLLATVGLLASWWLRPGDDPRWVYWPTGEQFGDTCGFIQVAGLPCPQCGMTRSWVHAVRGNLVTSFLSSPAGLGLFVWMLVGGGLAGYRLWKWDPFAVAVPWRITVGWAFFWMVGLYLGPWFLRLGGVNPLP